LELQERKFVKAFTELINRFIGLLKKRNEDSLSKKINGIFFILIFILVSFKSYSQGLKSYEFANSFYPGEKEKLSFWIDNFLKEAEVSQIHQIYGIISPHAGYIYSGKIAAYSYKVLKNERFDVVVLLGPSHRYYFEGVAVYPSGEFETPLGNLEVDKEIIQEFNSLEFFKANPKYFYGEHSLEVQLPFLIKVLGKVKIVPLIFGKVEYFQMKEVARKLKEISLKKKILLVVSTDLSHYHPYRQANRIDKETIKFIKDKDAYSLWVSSQLKEARACGIYPLITFLIYAQMKNAQIEILKYANSGDTFGRKTQVVGYLSAVAYAKENKEEEMREFALNEEEKITLLKIARKTLESFLKEGKIPQFGAVSENLKEKRGAFVTLKKNGLLRGCIGRIVADTALYKLISQVVIDSALNDPRFSPVGYEELKDIEIEISVLTPFTEIENLEEIEVGKHGLMIRKGFYSGLLLPQVPLEYGWGRETFLKHICLKAGLPPDAYKEKDVLLYKFSAIVFSEKDYGLK